MTEPEVVVLADPRALAQEAARRVAGAAALAISMRGRFAMALAGGSTPAALYRLLAQEPYRHQIDWSRTLLFFGDERCVPPDDPSSNFRMASETLLAHVPVPVSNVFRMQGETPGQPAADAYARVLQDALGSRSDLAAGSADEVELGQAGAPSLDLVLLGMGEDGHTASLFPGMPALGEEQQLVVWTPVPEYVRPAVSRLTLTLPTLNSARHVLFMVAGESKAHAVRSMLLGGEAAEALPAARVRPVDGTLTWLVDQAAAPGLAAS